MCAKTLLLAASSLAILVAASGADAQTPLRLGATVNGALDQSDASVEGDAEGFGGYRYEDYALRLRAGQRLEVVMRSEAFDAYLELYAPGVTEGDPLTSDDDGLGEGTDARLRFTPETAGVYTVRARSFSGDSSGAFSLTARERPRPPRAPRPRPIAVGGDITGALEAGDPELESGASYDAYAFRAAEGQRFAFSLESDDFDPVLLVGRMTRGDFEEAARNDDGPGRGLNAYLVFTAPEAGEYVVRATPLLDTASGGYRLSMEDAPPPRATQPIAVGDTVEGELSADDGTSDAGVRSDAYRFTGRAGQIIVAEMSSDTFDTYLTLYAAEDQATALATDDDGAGAGTNARLSHTLEADGDYVIEARAFDESLGAYSLTLSETPPPPPPAVVIFGETIQGKLEEGDATDVESRLYDAYVVRLEEGQRIQAILRSGDFDTYLEVGADADPFTALAYDDDGLQQGTDSRLNFTAPETGEYVIRALPLVGDNDGLYSLEIIDRGPEPTPGSIIVGATARGALTDADAIAPEGGYFDAYTLHAKADEKLILTLVSNDFDALIEVGRTNEAGEWESLASDDDSLSDTHARLEWTPDEDGTYEIRARSFAPASTGDYALMVERKPVV